MDSLNPKILIIGAGNMGSAFYRGLNEAVEPDRLMISDRNQEKIDALGAKGSIDPTEFIDEADWVIVAVKPQGFNDLMDQLGDRLKDKLVFSIMAGTSMDQLAEKTGSNRIIRSIPNLPITYGSGVVLWLASEAIGDEEKEVTQKLLIPMGLNVEVHSEEQLNQLCVISGSGPGFIAYFAQILEEKAMEWGFDQEHASQIVKMTFYGSGEWLLNAEQSPETCKNNVACKGGVTEAGLAHMNKNNLGQIMKDAYQKSLHRNNELSQ